MRYSPKQAALLRMFKKNQLRRINILHGSVRSGKTWISLVLWAFWILTQPKNGAYLMVAKTMTSLKRNCLDLLESLVGKSNFTYSLSQKEGVLFGRMIYLEGVNDIRAESKIRGMTLNGAYCDELTLFTEDFFTMLLSRLSEEGAKLFGTTNPDNPNHWFKVNYINRQDELNMLVMQFLIDENVFLPQEYIDDLKTEYTGVFYDRFILGLWVAAEGVIYRKFADNPDKFIIEECPTDIIDVRLGVDFGGNKSATQFKATGYTRNYKRVVVLKGEKRPGAVDNPETLERAFVAFCKEVKAQWPMAYYCYADSAEQILIRGLNAALKRAGVGIVVVNALKTEIVGRIRLVNSLMAQEVQVKPGVYVPRFTIMQECTDLIESLQVAVWDDKSDTEDLRLDNGTYNVDVLDAMEYTLEPVANFLQVLR